MSRIVLFGAGRGAAVAHRFLAGDTDHEVVAFAVDADRRAADSHRGLPLVDFEDLPRRYPPDDFSMLILLGYQEMNGLRRRKFDAAKAMGYRLESYVASDIFRVEPISVGENCFILDNQSISLDVSIGDNVVMWSSNHVGDMTRVEDHAWITSKVAVAANVVVGAGAFVGIGASIANGVRIGAGAFVGAGLAVAGDVAAESVAVAGNAAADLESRAFMRMMIAQKKL